MLSALLFTTLLALSGRFHCFSGESISRYDRSVLAENYLTQKNIEVQKHLVAPEYLGKFPFNLSIEIAGANQEENQPSEDTIDQVIFAFTQDFFLKNPDFLISFIEKTKKNVLPYSTIILISCDDEEIVLETPREIPCASEYYAERLYETNSTCAFVISDEDYFPSQIKTTAGGAISPMWIVRSVQKAFQSNQKNINVQQNILYNRKSELFKDESRFSAFTKNEITATSFPLGHTGTDLNILDSLEKEVIGSRKQGENTLYNVIPVKAFSIWINESLLTLIYLVFACMALFSLCFSSFAYNAKNEAIFKDLSRTWYFAPIYLILSAFFLWLFQWIYSTIAGNPLLYFSLKTTLALCCLFAVAALQNYYKFRISLSSISFQILILCALNIFIFAFIDLSLMFVFIVVYLIVFFAMKSNRKFLSVLTLLLMIAPFLQPATGIYHGLRADMLLELFRTSYSGNLIFSLILVPITFQWIRCMLIFNIKDKFSAGKKSTAVISGITVSILCSVLIFSLFLAGAMLITKKLSSDKKQKAIFIKEATINSVSFDYSTSDNFDLVTHKLDISTEKEKKILRCFITFTADSNPLYECNFNYTMTSATEAEIEIPDGPEETFSIIFSSDYGVPVHAKMEFYILTDDFTALHEVRELDLTGKINVGKAI